MPDKWEYPWVRVLWPYHFVSNCGSAALYLCIISVRKVDRNGSSNCSLSLSLFTVYLMNQPLVFLLLYTRLYYCQFLSLFSSSFPVVWFSACYCISWCDQNNCQHSSKHYWKSWDETNEVKNICKVIISYFTKNKGIIQYFHIHCHCQSITQRKKKRNNQKGNKRKQM